MSHKMPEYVKDWRETSTREQWNRPSLFLIISFQISNNLMLPVSIIIIVYSYFMLFFYYMSSNDPHILAMLHFGAMSKDFEGASTKT